MNFEWEFFENLNEMVYVSEIETGNLIYMNARLRKVFGFNSEEDYKGKKCYDILQGEDNYCKFCSNYKLKSGEFFEWTYKNPILNKSFSIKDTLVIKNGKRYRLEIAIGLEEQEETQNSYFFARTDTIINECLQYIYSTSDINQALNNLLEFIGQKFACERSYIFERNQNNCFDNTYEWCAEGVAPQKELLQNEPEQTIKWWLELFESKQIVVIEDVESIRETYPLAYAALKPQDIKSLITGPIYSGDKIEGFIGVDNPDAKMLTILKQLLNVIGYFIQSILKRRDLVCKLQQINSGNFAENNNIPVEKMHSDTKESEFIKFITNNKFYPEALFESITFRNSSYYLYFGDLQANKFYISDNMRDTFGFTNNVVSDLLKKWEDRISTPEHLQMYRSDLDRLIREKKTVHDLRYQVKDISGNNIWVRCFGILKWNEDKTVPLFFSGRVSCQDNDFVVDAVTNFPREHAAIMQINELSKENEKIEIIGFCLNNFREINETKGRHFGNLFLKHIANRLSNKFGSKLLFYRLDGVRFMAIVSPTSNDKVGNIVDQIRDIIDLEYRTEDILVNHSSSFGVLNYFANTETPQTLLENIITLISVAKNFPEQKYIEHSPENIQKMKEMATLALQLSQDVSNNMNNFRLVVQPIIDTKNNKPLKGEALLRWSYKNKDISPTVFIPILEKNKMILSVGKWVFEQVVRTGKRLLAYEPDFCMSFNVSYLQIMDDDFITFIQSTLEKYNISGSHFIAELTETHFDENPEKLKKFVYCCKKLGIEIALDDFGMGYSSLALLLRYPANIIKLDRMLLTEITESKDKMNFIRSIVYACHQFGKTVCVEGVESAEEEEIIKNTGCDMIQGYFYYKPLEIADVYNLLMEENKH